jgi:hypothetical protein
VFDFPTLKLMHVHDGERYPMTERQDHDPADHDPERGWARGARIFSCSHCDEEILVEPPGHEATEA